MLQLLYYIILSNFCQVNFLWMFFNISWSSAKLCSLRRISEILISPLQLLYYITSLRFCQVNKLWTEISFCSFQSILFPQHLNEMHTIFSFALSLSKAFVKFSSLPLRCTLLPASVFLSFPLPVLRTLSSSLTPPFLVRQLYYYIHFFWFCQPFFS